MPDNADLLQQIKVVADQLGLDEYVIEKDLYLTKAIGIISGHSYDKFDLILQGGTSLTKAHRIIERMSEDCDFRICLKRNEKQTSKESERRILRTFRHDIVAKLKENNFTINDNDIKVRNEGRFMAVRASYPSMYPLTIGIRPYLSLEFFLGDLKITPVTKSVTTLVKQVLRERVEFPNYVVNSVSIIETAAEKWVALTRRIAAGTHKTFYRDPNLVRHLYDLYKINQQGYFSSEFEDLVLKVVMSDRKQFKNHNMDYYHDPVREIKRSLKELNEYSEWSNNWDTFVKAMVFEQNKPNYETVLQNLNDCSKIAISKLEEIDFSIPTV